MNETKKITVEEAREAWETLKDNEFMLMHFPDFDSYWRDCERINGLSQAEYVKLKNRCLRKRKMLKKLGL